MGELVAPLMVQDVIILSFLRVKMVVRNLTLFKQH
jgi:hypothetical protein